MRKVILIIVFISLFCVRSKGQTKVINYHLFPVVPGNTLLAITAKNAQEEHLRQKKIKEQQDLTTAEQFLIKRETSKWNKFVTKAQKRFEQVGFAVDVVDIGIDLKESMETVFYNQKETLKLIKSNPSLAKGDILNLEKDLISQIEMLGRYLTGSALQVIDIFGMENADRQKIIFFIKNDIYRVERQSQRIYSAVQHADFIQKFNKRMWKEYMNREKEIITDIIEKAKKF